MKNFNDPIGNETRDLLIVPCRTSEYNFAVFIRPCPKHTQGTASVYNTHIFNMTNIYYKTSKGHCFENLPIRIDERPHTSTVQIQINIFYTPVQNGPRDNTTSYIRGTKSLSRG